ncbi:MAG: hypothetical protein KBI11_07025 [Bacteroidales bacterium]|nr:hypothetical protein [Bacteroidales bacterium]HRC94604.1 hypothetical protein [Tenuifilaceae bacterium]
MTFKPDRWLSILLHPLFMMCYAFLTLYLSASYISFLPDSYKRLLFIALFLNTIIIPIFILMLLKRLGTVKSIELFHHRERVFPIVMVIIPYVFTLLLLIRLQVPEIFIKIVQGGILAMIIAATVSYWWKISLHMVGIGGVTGFIIAGLILHYFTSLNLLVVVVVLSGLLVSARLVRGDHCPSQVYTGYFTGLASILLVFLL